jgi:hypothetical protein
MICCGEDLGKGQPFVMLRYWCERCKTEHLVDAQEMTDYLAKLAQSNDKLPDIL